MRAGERETYNVREREREWHNERVKRERQNEKESRERDIMRAREREADWEMERETYNLRKRERHRMRALRVREWDTEWRRVKMGERQRMWDGERQPLVPAQWVLLFAGLSHAGPMWARCRGTAAEGDLLGAQLCTIQYWLFPPFPSPPLPSPPLPSPPLPFPAQALYACVASGKTQATVTFKTQVLVWGVKEPCSFVPFEPVI